MFIQSCEKKEDEFNNIEQEESIDDHEGEQSKYPVASFQVDTNVIVFDDTVYFTDHSANKPTSWEWDFGDGTTSTKQNPSHVYTEKGNYSVKLVVTNEYGDNELLIEGCITVLIKYDTVTDYDGNTYRTVKIGEQWWMTENLRVTHYADGTPIPHVESDSVWKKMNISDKAYCIYPDKKDYGAYYTWAAAMNGAESSNTNPSGVQGVCPEGWHLPSLEEWNELENYVASKGFKVIEGVALSSVTYDKYNYIPNDDFGFCAKNTGTRRGNGIWGDEYYGFWWTSVLGSSSNLGYIVWTGYIDYSLISCTTYEEYTGNPVRCLKD